MPRPRTGQLHTNKSWPDSLQDLRDEFRKWGVDDYLLPTKKECTEAGAAWVDFAIGGRWCRPMCNRWQKRDSPNWLERNLRAIVLALESARLADARGIGGILHEVTRPLALTTPLDYDPDSPEAILGVAPGADIEVVRAAYRTLVKKHHPDVPGGDAAKFRRIHEAAQALGVSS